MLVAILVFSGLFAYQHGWENDQSIKMRLDKLEQAHAIQKRAR